MFEFSSSGNVKIVQLLANNGANIDLKDKYNKSAINLASSNRGMKLFYYFSSVEHSKTDSYMPIIFDFVNLFRWTKSSAYLVAQCNNARKRLHSYNGIKIIIIPLSSHYYNKFRIAGYKLKTLAEKSENDWTK